MWVYSARICFVLVLVFIGGTWASSRHSQSDDGVTRSTSPYTVQLSTNYHTLYSAWSRWTRCDSDCTQKRTRSCVDRTQCPHENRLVERRRCSRITPAGRCLPPVSRRWGVGSKIRDVMYDIVYESWSTWSACTRSCRQRRVRMCEVKKLCENSVLVEERRCYVKNTACDKRRTDEVIGVEKGQSGEEEEEEEDAEEKETMVSESDEVVSGSEESGDVTSGLTSVLVPTEVTASGEPHQLPDTCGVRSVSGSLRIVGGQEARPGSWPWQVAILTRWREHYCAGVLVTPQWVLTAAHCLRKKARHRKIIIRTGEYDLASSAGSEMDHRSFTTFIHPDFDLQTIDSDIALVKLPQPVADSAEVSVACVPDETDVLPHKTLCHAVGWGKMKNTHIYGTDVLREAAVPLVDHARCQDAFEFEITRNQMCAGYRRGGADTCAGDSGGPLMCEIRRGGRRRWYVYGVTSFGEGCGDRGKYGIYTKVINFSEWISRTIRENS